MKGFMIANGDLVIDNNEISTASDAELIRQTIQSIISTNKGEWLLDEEEGIDFDIVLGVKEVDSAVVKSEIQHALEQVDEKLTIEEFSCEYEKGTRRLNVHFKAKNANGEEVVINNTWG